MTMEMNFNCPRCGGNVPLKSATCTKCRFSYPRLGGVLLLVSDPKEYALEHVKGIASRVPLSELPIAWRGEFKDVYKEVLSQQGQEHIEEDLEAERVNALYLMNHYLTHKSPALKSQSKKINELIRAHWDHGPMEKVAELVKKSFGKISQNTKEVKIVELGCSVGGLLKRLDQIGVSGQYLGVDSSFASVWLARTLFGLNPNAELKLNKQRLYGPGDLLQGTVSALLDLEVSAPKTIEAEFVVMELGQKKSPLKKECFDFCIALNAIDMLEEPWKLPELQYDLVREGGTVIQSSPYIWAERVAKRIRKKYNVKVEQTSAQVVESMYQKSGLEVIESYPDIEWLFYKNQRQLELYSVHLFAAKKV